MNKEFEEAIQDNRLNAVRQMLKLRPRLLGQTDSYARTPLMLAVSTQNRSVECVSALIEAGADVNAKTSEGLTALHWAIDIHGYRWEKIAVRIVRLLVDSGAHLEEQQHFGWTPLMKAVLEGTPDQVRALLAMGANPNAQFPQHAMPAFMSGRFILSIALTDLRVAKLLLKAGADVNARDEHGQTVLEYAQHALRESESGDTCAEFKESFRQKLTAGIELIRRAEIAR